MGPRQCWTALDSLSLRSSSLCCRTLQGRRSLATSSNEAHEPHLLQRFTLPPGSRNSTLDATGLSVWGTARPLLGHLKRHVIPSFQQEKSTIRVLELGAGCGLVGLGLASSCKNSRVVLTDHADAVEWLRKNVELNRNLVGDRATVAQLTWGDERHMSGIVALQSNFDLIVGSDLMYDPNSHKALLETLKCFAVNEYVTIYLGFPMRSSSEERFLDLLRRESFGVNVEALDEGGKAMLAVARIVA